MKIELTQDELNEAVREYMKNKFNLTDCPQVKVTHKYADSYAGRGEDTYEIDFVVDTPDNW